MERPLLLPSAKTIVLEDHPRERYIRNTAIVIGLIAVLIGAADLSSRMADTLAGERALFDAFAPAAALW